MRRTIIFGNGLGMAVNHYSFSLATALESTWREGRALSPQQRQLISTCLGTKNHDEPPKHEEQLDLLQQVLASCDFLRQIPMAEEIHWLSDRGREFPTAIRRFVHEVAAFFHRQEGSLPVDFIISLAEYIRESKSHVATLNYDNLLYQPLIDQRILAGYDGYLFDGFLKRGFSEEALERFKPNDKAWYLHLHGSPLFCDNEGGVPVKLNQRALLLQGPQASQHIVLTHVKHKPSIIQASRVLSTYWEYLEKAFAESDEIMLFGYSGLDNHLNDRIARHAGRRPIRVVEWAGSGAAEERYLYWHAKLNCELIHEQIANILRYKEWQPRKQN